MPLLTHQEVSVKLPAVTFGKEHVVQSDGLLILSEEFEKEVIEAYDYAYTVSREFDDFGDEIFELLLVPNGIVFVRDEMRIREGETLVELSGSLRKLEDLH